VFGLSEFIRSLFLQGFGQRFPEASHEKIRRIGLRRLSRRHDRNYPEAVSTRRTAPGGGGFDFRPDWRAVRSPGAVPSRFKTHSCLCELRWANLDARSL